MNSSRFVEPRSRLAPALFVLSLAVFAVARVSAMPAFPGAEGFGAESSGGRGGSVYHVTNLNDSGPGSFRDAVSVAGRTVVFDVGGIITISSPVIVKSNITIAGQTAPGEGVTIYGDRLSYSGANNTITRYIRYREGINGDSGTDAVGADSGDLMMFDHVSASWGRDETFSLSGTPSHVTLQDCIIGEGLLVHSAGSLMQTSGGVSIFRCLYIDNWMRNPKVKGVNDYQNNVVYNWGSGGGYIPGGDSAGLTYANLINNYFIAGPNTGSEGPFKSGNANYSLYHAGNLQDLNVNGALDGVAVTDASFPTLTLVATPFDYPAPATLLTADQAYTWVLGNAGASLHRDHADQVMTSELASLGTVGAQIYDESAIGGVGTVAGGVPLADTDGDGIPDAWEAALGTNPLVADNNGDITGDGYTNLEKYLNALAPGGVQAATIDGIADDTGSSSMDGVTADNTLVLNGTAAAGATVTIYRLDTGALGTVTADGTGHWNFDYSGTSLPDRYYAFYATVDLGAGKISPPTRAFLVKVDTTAAAAPTISSVVTSPAMAFNGTAEPGAIINVSRVGVGIVGTGTADGLGNWTAAYSGPALPAGAYSFTAAATDLAGNTGSDSAAYTVNTALAAPAFTGIVSDTGIAGDGVTNDTTLSLTGTSFAGAVVSILRDSNAAPIGTATANGSGAWTFDYTGTVLTPGVHTFRATASDGSSFSPASALFTVTIDTTRPTVSSIKRQNPTTAATTASTLVFRVTFSEAVTGVDLTDFTATRSTGVTGSIASCTTVTASVYDVTVTGVAGDGTIRLDLKSSGTGIADIAANTISGGYTAGQVYTIRLPGSGVWISDVDGEAYSTTTDWQDGVVANGTGATADFAQQNIDGPISVRLDGPRTLGRVVFGDLDWSTPAEWTLTDGGSSANVLTLDGPTPSLQVDAASSPSGDTVAVPAAAATPSNLDVILAGTAGFTKTGIGTLQILKPATISGPLTISKGIVQVGTGGSLTTSSVAISTSQQLRVAGGSFSTTGDTTWVSGTGTGIIVSAGNASFQRILPSNVRNSFVKVSGGTMTATEITFPRSGDSESQALSAGIQISGGDVTVGTIGLGTANSWGAMTISGGRTTVTGPLNVAWQATGGRGGDVVVSGGELDVTDASAGSGLILARNPGSNANNVAKFTITGGVSNVARLALGYDPTVTAGSATVSLTNGELSIGAGGIVKNGTGAFAANVNLTRGTLGAIASWSTAVPLNIDGTPATLAVRAGDGGGTAFDVMLTGGIIGAGGFAKTGGGTLTLAGATAATFAGDAEINAGTLRVLSGIATAAANVTVNAGATLAGNGTIGRSLVLNSGGVISPDGAAPVATLAASALTWNDGGTLAVDLGASGSSDQLVLGDTLTKAGAGMYNVAFTPGAGFAAGNTYTLATFASTNFDASDFQATGLPVGTGALFQVKDTSLRVRIQARPTVGGSSTATGTYLVPLIYMATADDLPATFAATGLPPGLAIDPTTGVVTGTPVAAGVFNATITATNTAGSGFAVVQFAIAKAVALVAVGTPSNSTVYRDYSGAGQTASITTEPAGLNATYTYDGSATAPTLPGTYAVVATIDDPNYSGTADGTLVIRTTALTRHAPVLNASLDGSIQVSSGESFALNGGASISSDILVPGTPEIRFNGQPTFVGTQDAGGAMEPSNYSVTLNGSAVVRYIVRRVDPIAMPAASAPQPPAGTRNVVVNRPGDAIGDVATVRSLTVNGNVGAVALPPGAYDTIAINGGTMLVLGAGASDTPAVYDLQRLTLNGGASIQVTSPVVLRLAKDLVICGNIGSSDQPPLTIELAHGNVTLNGAATVYADVRAPDGTATLNGDAVLHGHLAADRLVLNGRSLLQQGP